MHFNLSGFFGRVVRKALKLVSWKINDKHLVGNQRKYNALHVMEWDTFWESCKLA